jgi:hypothetical protein
MVTPYITTLCSVAVNELVRFCDSSPNITQSFNSTSNEVKLLFHSDSRSESYQVRRGFSLRFNASQEGEYSISFVLYIYILIPLITNICNTETCQIPLQLVEASWKALLGYSRAQATPQHEVTGATVCGK